MNKHLDTMTTSIKKQLKNEGYRVFWYFKTPAIELGVAKKDGGFFTIHYIPDRGKAFIHSGVDMNPASPTKKLQAGIDKAKSWILTA